MTARALRDPHLGDLSGVVDEAVVRSQLADRWPGPPQAPLEISAVERHWVRVVPGRSCTVVHHVRGVREGEPVATFVVGLRTPGGTTWRSAAEDPELHELGDVLGARRRIGPLASAEVVALRYRPGRRCTVSVRTVDGGRYAKFLARDAHRQRQLLTELGRHPRPGFTVATPTDIPPAGPRVVVTEPMPGVSAWDVLTTPGSLGRRAVLARRIGRRLSELHRVPTTVGTVHLLGEQLTVAASWLHAVEVHQPAVAESARRLLYRLDEQHRPDDLVLTHGSFRFDQVLCHDDGTLGIIDLDSAGLGVPERDLGNCLAYVDWRTVRQPALANDLAVVARQLLEGYRSGGGTIRDDRLAHYRAAASVKIAWRRFANLDTSEWSRVPDLVALATRGVDRDRSEPFVLTGVI